MNSIISQKRFFVFMRLFIVSMILLTINTSFIERNNSSNSTGTLKISFINTANGNPVILRDSVYSNYFGEKYSIRKLKYYISNVILSHNAENKNVEGYYLMNATAENNNFEIRLEPGKYNKLGFLLGVDSIRNCSGAQTGALDPMNDMFWTWNSGYVMFKLEGTSASSTADLNRIEYHIGGYKGANNVATRINFNFADDHLIEIKSNSTTEVVIEMNLDNYWHGKNDIKISEVAAWMTMGGWATKIAANFQNLFSIKSIQNIP